MRVERYMVVHDIPNKDAQKLYIPLNTMKNMMLSDWVMVRSVNEGQRDSIIYKIVKNRYATFNDLVNNSSKMTQFLEICPKIKVIHTFSQLPDLFLTEDELIIVKMIF